MAVLPDFLKSVKKERNLVLQAPTGAGKTTVVPLALFEEGCIEGKILVLQPRRITCVSVARRMAELFGEKIGETVGYRIRHDHMVGNTTRIEVVTEGILVRMLHTNPTLEGIGCVFFDEFHERNVDSDVSFALCIAAQRQHQLQTRIVVMSATFGSLAKRVSGLLDNCKMVMSEGRVFPVETNYLGLVDLQNYEPRGPFDFAKTIAGAVAKALEDHDGDALVFLPGEREIMYTWIALNNMGLGDGQTPRNLVGWAHKLIDKNAPDLSKCVQVSTLYSTMDQREQDDVLLKREPGWRKVILSTPIAESSITVPGVKIVVDCGLRRNKVEEPETAMSYMQTVPISMASADQRSGRAGRVSPGVCYRLWSEEQHQTLRVNDEPEIERADLTNVVLDLGMGGHLSDESIFKLPWVDAPPSPKLDQGRSILQRLKALEPARSGEQEQEGVWALTERGERLARFPLHPRLSHMIEQALQVSGSFARDACDLAALLEEKELLRGGRSKHGADLEARLDALQDPKMDRDVYYSVKERVLKASEQLQNIAELRQVLVGRKMEASERKSLCVLLAWAFPELIAEVAPAAPSQRRGITYSLSNGHETTVEHKDQLSKHDLLTIATLTGQKVFWAMRADRNLLENYGIDAAKPQEHEVLGLVEEPDVPLGPQRGRSEEEEEEEEEEVQLLAVRRYLIDKDVSEVKSVDDVVTSMAENPKQFQTSEVVSLLWDLAREEPVQEELVQRIADEVAQPRLEEFSVSEMAQVACALACAGVHSEALAGIAEAMAPQLAELPTDGGAGNCSGLLWAVSSMEVSDENLDQQMAERAVEEMVKFEPRVLSDVREVCFWSFHRESASQWSNKKRFESLRPGFAHEAFFWALSPIVKERLAEISPITCVYLMWSFSKAGVYDEELFNAVAERVGPDVQKLDRCGLTMFCWNYAYAEIENEEVFRLVAEDTLRPERMAEMAPRDVSGVAWAFAKAGVRNEELMLGLREHACSLLRDGLTQCCWRGPSKSLFKEMYVGDGSAVEGKVDGFDCVSLGDMLWAFMEQQVPIHELESLTEEYVTLGLSPENNRNARRLIRYPSALAKVLIACASLPGDHGRLFELAEPHMSSVLWRLPMYYVAKLTWAWAVVGILDDFLLAALDERLRKLLMLGKGEMLEPHDVRNLQWACEELGLGDEAMRGRLASLPSS